MLNTGLEQYVDALIALREFRREVWHVSRTVVARYAAPLRDAVGGTQSFSSVGEYSYPGPEKSGWNGAWVASRVKGLEFGSFYAGLIWYDPGSSARHASAVAMCEFDGGLIERARAEFKPLGAIVHGNEIHFAEPLTNHDATKLEERLSSCIEKWVQAWTRVGGIAGLRGA